MTTIVASQNLNRLIVTHTALAVTYLNYNFTNSVNYGGTIIQYYYETQFPGFIQYELLTMVITINSSVVIIK